MRLATVVFVGRPLARVARRQAVFVHVRRETRVVTEVRWRPTVVGAVAYTDRIVVEDTRSTVRTCLVGVRELNDRRHTRATGKSQESISPSEHPGFDIWLAAA